MFYLSLYFSLTNSAEFSLSFCLSLSISLSYPLSLPFPLYITHIESDTKTHEYTQITSAKHILTGMDKALHTLKRIFKNTSRNTYIR